MAIQESYIDYPIGDSTHQAFLAWDDAYSDARPAVMVGHAWGGRSEFEEDKARWLASHGYVGVAIDMYGKGILGSSPEENAALMTPLVENRSELQGRMQASLAMVQGLEQVDPARCASMGYCFGGLCALDLARIGTGIAGVISIHGLFIPAGNTDGVKITAKVLCLHGYDDPMADPQSMVALASELTEAEADWQVHAYGRTLHSFTNPQANNPDMGTVYSPLADARSTTAITNFLGELFRE